MTWTVNAMGNAGTAATVTTPVSTMTLTANASAGESVAVFIMYTDTVTDTFTVKDNAGNLYTNRDSIVDTGQGQGTASAYFINLPGNITSITVNGSTPGAANVIQDFGAIRFSNSVAGTLTLDGHAIQDNSTATTTPNSGSTNANSTNGDLVLAGISGNGTAMTSPALTMTGVTTTTVRNDHNTVSSYQDGSGVTTTGGANSVTSTWTVGAAIVAVVPELIFKPPGASFVPPHRRAVSYSIPIFLRR